MGGEFTEDEISAPVPLIRAFRMSPLLAWSISLDITYITCQNRLGEGPIQKLGLDLPLFALI